MENKELLGFDDRWFRLFGIPVIGLLVPGLLDEYSKITSLKMLGITLFFSFFYTTVYWEFHRWYFIRLKTWFPDHEQITKRIVFQILGSAGFITGFTSLNSLWEPENYKTTCQSPSQLILVILVVSMCVLAVYGAVFYYKISRKAMLDTERLKQEQLISQLETLKNQVNPHFLFNSLNTLAAIIPEDSKLAVLFVKHLSKVYRYILEIREQRLVSLRQELSALESYRFLLEIRFGANLRFEQQIPADILDLLVVPLSLQMLIENAVKHNVISTQHPLTIEILADEKQILVRNSLQPKPYREESTGLGLQNIRSRYELLGTESVLVAHTAQTFTVKLPLIRPNYEKAAVD